MKMAKDFGLYTTAEKNILLKMTVINVNVYNSTKDEVRLAAEFAENPDIAYSFQNNAGIRHYTISADFYREVEKGYGKAKLEKYRDDNSLWIIYSNTVGLKK